jgi:hypothetical protein
VFSETLNNPLRVEWHDWLSDSDGWFGKQIKMLIDRIKDFFKSVITEIYENIVLVIETIKGFAESVGQFFVSFWSYLKGFFQGCLYYFFETLDWLAECLADWYEYLSDLVTDFWDLFSETVTTFCEWCLEWVWYIGEWLWELLLSCGDELIALLVEMIGWLFDTLLPKIDMPEGFEQGVTYFIQYGMLMNELLPIREAFSLFALYVAIVIVVGIFYRILKHLPVIGG